MTKKVNQELNKFLKETNRLDKAEYNIVDAPKLMALIKELKKQRDAALTELLKDKPKLDRAVSEALLDAPLSKILQSPRFK